MTLEEAAEVVVLSAHRRSCLQLDSCAADEMLY